MGEDYFGQVVHVSISCIRLEEDDFSDDDQRRLDAALSKLGCLTHLMELRLESTLADQADLADLKRLTRLKKLTLQDARITDLGLVQTMTQLEKLNLNDSPANDAGLAHLKGLTHLRSLALVGTEITDAGLARLKDLTSLQDLYLCDLQEGYRGDMKITDTGVRELQRAMPTLRIMR